MTALLPGHGLERPTAESAIDAMSKLVGREEALRAWKNACESAKVKTDAASVEELMSVVECLKNVPPPLNAVAATSMRVRLLSYRALEALHRMKEGSS